MNNKKCGSGQDKFCNCCSCKCGTAGCERSLTVFPCDPVTGQPPYPPPMKNEDSATLYKGSASATGRYFQYAVDFTSQFANDRFRPEADESGGYRDRELHDPLQPQLRSMRVFYKPAEGRVISNIVGPGQLQRWRSVKYREDVTSGGSVQVDVLDVNNVPLFTNVLEGLGPSGFSLEGLDPAQYPALRLRATIDNAGDNAKRPTLVSWELTWETFSESLRVDRNSISFSKGHKAAIAVTLFAAREGSLTVHDAAGQLVKELHRGGFGAGETTKVWDGTNERGQQVAPGIYFISLRAKEIRSVNKLAVVE